MRSWFDCDLQQLLVARTDDIVGRLALTAAEKGLDPNPESIAAWTETVTVLRRAAELLIRDVPDSAAWRLFLEFEIPRRQRRIDAVILAGGFIVIAEF